MPTLNRNIKVNMAKNYFYLTSGPYCITINQFKNFIMLNETMDLQNAVKNLL